jgi:hypothetical protein
LRNIVFVLILPRMDNLSINRVSQEAPAAAPRRNAVDDGLIDTALFLRFVKTNYEMIPVVAVQGSGHRDAGRRAKPENGRHLVVAAGRSGLAAVLLNSHFKDRRAHIGLGFATDGVVLIGPSMPVQRWRGFEEPLKELMGDDSPALYIGKVIGTLSRMRVSESDCRLLARDMAKKGYLASIEARPSVAGLLEGFAGSSMYDLGIHLLKKMREGNIESSVRGGRRIKRIRRPDGLFHAGMICFDRMYRSAQARGKLSTKIDFGKFDERLVRP